jgi:hypothetical protein
MTAPHPREVLSTMALPITKRLGGTLCTIW